MSSPRCCITRNRLASRTGRWGLTLLLALGSVPAAWAQPTVEEAAAPAPAFNWPLLLLMLAVGIALGLLAARLLGRKGKKKRRSHGSSSGVSSGPAGTPAAVPIPKRRAENVPMTPAPPPEAPAASTPKKPIVQSMSEVQGRKGRPASKPNDTSKPSGAKGKSSHQAKASPGSQDVTDWTVPHRPAAMNPTPETPKGNEPLEPGQSVEWTAPTSTPPAIQELIDSTASAPEVPIDRDARVEALTSLEAAAASIGSAGPVHYYAPAPDVPSIEHRKLSPNPLPQMPLLITLPHAEATTAQFSFSPQADQSRIIGNGVRELKEFFAFELPPTEQFTTIKNLAPGKLEKRDDTWHVLQKAGIALS